MMIDLPGDELQPADYRSLESRWISRELTDVARIRRVDSDTGKLLVGRRDHSDYGGLAIPYFLPGESRVREWRLRRNHPEIEYKHGKPKERGKYLSPPGRKNLIYFVPGVSPDLVKAVRSESKTLCGSSLGTLGNARPRARLQFTSMN